MASPVHIFEQPIETLILRSIQTLHFTSFVRVSNVVLDSQGQYFNITKAWCEQ